MTSDRSLAFILLRSCLVMVALGWSPCRRAAASEW
ncbi:hypothetical protein ABXZ33_00634 [Clavibacter nebraskensis]